MLMTMYLKIFKNVKYFGGKPELLIDGGNNSIQRVMCYTLPSAHYMSTA